MIECLWFWILFCSTSDFLVQNLSCKVLKGTLVQALRLCTGRTAHRGVEIQLYPFMTKALEWGEGSASHPGPSLPPGKTRYPLYRRQGEPQGQSGQVRKISTPPAFDPRTVQPVASRYTRPNKYKCTQTESPFRTNPTSHLRSTTYCTQESR